jgi:site-specific recombinase XerC
VGIQLATPLMPSKAAATPLAFTTDWRVVVKAYLDATIDSPHTRRAYRRHLQAAFAWLDVAAVADLTGAQLAAYRARLTTRAAGYIVERATKAAGIAAKHNRLRHTFAIRSLRSRHDVIAVQKLLGHASVAATQRYLDHLDLAELRRAVPDLPGAKTAT